MLNYYRRCLKNAAKEQAILNDYLKNSKKNDKRPIHWTPEADAAFTKCLHSLANAATLAHPREGAPLILTTDASNTAIGATLEQIVEDQTQPLTFFSKKLNAAQRNYSTYDRELLAIYEAVKHTKDFIAGREISIRTDHKPLTFAFKQKPDKASPRQARQLDFISQFTTNITYVKGSENIAADTLSRVQAINCPVITSSEDLAEEQHKDQELQEILNGKTCLNLRPFTLPESQHPLYCECEDDAIKPYVPKPLRRKIFDSVHGLAHPSGRSTRQQIRQKFVWPGMNKDIISWARTCLQCQRAKIHKHIRLTPDKIAMPDERFQQIHLDIIGPLPRSKSSRYCLTMIDRYTRWPEAVPLSEITAENVAAAFYGNWIARFGAPNVITTDQGTQFEAGLFKALTNLVGCKRIRTSPYHPASNGLLERWHRTLKTALTCQLIECSEWTTALPTVLLGLRTAYKEDIKCSTAEMVYGKTLRIPGEFFEDVEQPVDPELFAYELRERLRKIRPKPTVHHGARSTFFHKNLHESTHVFLRDDSVRRPLQPPYSGPHEVLARVNERLYTILVNGKACNISTERLKPAYLPVVDIVPATSTPGTSNTARPGMSYTPTFQEVQRLPTAKRVTFK
ncbi:hypothetical protein KM043_015788 [Ampulex compressa]|nr:hypothetical protein KM043_015788 [Ampulex compressa]